MMHHDTDFETVLQCCLERLEQGGSIQACLRDYPAHAAALAPLLAAADALRWCSLPPLSDAAHAAIRAQALAAFARQVAHRPPRRSAWRGAGLRSQVLALACVVLLVVSGIGISVAAAQASLPGSRLYPLKRESEQVRLALAGRPQAQSALYLDFATRRLAEALALAASGRAPERALATEFAANCAQAWQTIAQLPAAQQAPLRRQYTAVVREHQARLTTALAGTAAPAARAVLASIVQASRQATALPAAHRPPAAPAAPAATRGGAPLVVTDTKPTLAEGDADLKRMELSNYQRKRELRRIGLAHEGSWSPLPPPDPH